MVKLNINIHITVIRSRLAHPYFDPHSPISLNLAHIPANTVDFRVPVDSACSVDVIIINRGWLSPTREHVPHLDDDSIPCNSS